MTLYVHRTTGEQRDIDAALIAAWRSAGNPKFDAWALATPRPADTRIQRHNDSTQLIDGEWQQVWVARAATAQEQVEWDLANRPLPPEPDWLEFVTWLYSQPAMMAAMGAARASTSPQGEPATTALPAALEAARNEGNYPAFALTWGQFLLASGLPAQALAPIVAKAQEMHLPAEFVAALQPQPPTP